MPHSNINRVVLVGRLTQDPELRSLPSGYSVCALRIACNGVRRDADGAYHERPNFFDVSVFGPHGENVHRHLGKGRLVAIDGHLEWREWEAAEQQRRQAVGIVADTVEFLDGPRGAGDEAPVGDDPSAGHELVGVGAGESDLAF